MCVFFFSVALRCSRFFRNTHVRYTNDKRSIFSPLCGIVINDSTLNMNNTVCSCMHMVNGYMIFLYVLGHAERRKRHIRQSVDKVSHDAVPLVPCNDAQRRKQTKPEYKSCHVRASTHACVHRSVRVCVRVCLCASHPTR